MHYDAALRVRELTQNIFDIGDEIANHIDNLAEACADWDSELVEDCLHELREVVAEGRAEVRPGLAELNGLRQAFVSGVRAGEMSNTFAHPGRTLSFLHKNLPEPPPTSGGGQPDTAAHTPATTTVASTTTWRLWMRERNETTIAALHEMAEWVVAQTKIALESQAVLLPQAYSKALQQTTELITQWHNTISQQPHLAASMRGECPPQFLAERARVERIVAKLRNRRAHTG